MVKNKKVIFNIHLFLIVLVTFLFFAPFFFNPKLLTAKDNDLGRTYVPMLHFLKESFVKERTIPLWRPDQMMGEPLVGNPLYPAFYPLNAALVFLPPGFFSVVFYFLHFVIAGTSTYYLSRSFQLKKHSSLTAAFLYTFSIKMLIQMSAGHITMVAAFSFFPLAFLSLRKILLNSSFKWIISCGFSLSLILILYPTIFYYTSIFLFFYSIYFLFTRKKHSLKKLFKLSAAYIIGFAFSAIHLLPQLEFGSLSTRSQMNLEDVALPLWNLKKLLTSLFFPYLNFKGLDHEEFLYLGSVTTILGIVGFIKLSGPKKIIFTLFGVLTIFFVAGLSTPIFPLAYELLPYLNYSRITTRLWFVVALIAALLSAYALNNIKSKSIIYFLIILFLAESIFIGYKKISTVPQLYFGNEYIYQFLAGDNDIFRVYCTTYCFNPQLVSKYNIEVLHGETPIQDKRFVNFLQKAGNYNFSNFAVIFPPYQIWQVENKPSPNTEVLGRANVKYVASTYEISKKDLQLVKKFENVFLYKNNLFKPRAVFEDSSSAINIKKYSSNEINMDFNKTKKGANVILAEKFYPGWEASSNGKKLDIQPHKDIFRYVNVPIGASNLALAYSPKSFRLGKNITIVTSLLLIFYLWYTRKQKLNE